MRLAYEAPALRLVATGAGDVIYTSDTGDNGLAFPSSLADDGASAGSSSD